MAQRRFGGVRGVHHSDARHRDDHPFAAEASEVVVPPADDHDRARVERGAGKDRIRLRGEGGQDKGALIGFHDSSASIVSLVACGMSIGKHYSAA